MTENCEGNSRGWPEYDEEFYRFNIRLIENLMNGFFRIDFNYSKKLVVRFMYNIKSVKTRVGFLCHLQNNNELSYR